AAFASLIAPPRLSPSGTALRGLPAPPARLHAPRRHRARASEAARTHRVRFRALSLDRSGPDPFRPPACCSARAGRGSARLRRSAAPTPDELPTNATRHVPTPPPTCGARDRAPERPFPASVAGTATAPGPP